MSLTTTQHSSEAVTDRSDWSFRSINCRIIDQKAFDPDSPVDTVVYMTTDIVDTDGEVVDPRGGDFSVFKDNPVLMLLHSPFDPAAQSRPAKDLLPVGRVDWWKIRPHGIMAGLVFARGSQLGQEVKALFDENILRGVSIGFKPIEVAPMTPQEAASRPDWQEAYTRRKSRVNVIKKWKLYELSVVPIPANSQALKIKCARMGIEIPEWVAASGGMNVDETENETENDVTTKACAAMKPGCHVKWAHKGMSGCGKILSIHAKGDHPHNSDDDQNSETLSASEGNPVVHVQVHKQEDGKCMGTDAGEVRKCHMKNCSCMGGHTKAAKEMDDDADMDTDAMKDDDEVADGEMSKAAMCGKVAEAAKGIKHCGEYGHAFYHHGDKAVHHVMSDSDTAEDGYDDEKVIRSKYMAVKGIKSVAVEAEYAPAGEDWEQVHPAKDKPAKKAMGESSGAAGGDAVPDDDMEMDDDTEMSDETEADDDKRIKRHDFVDINDRERGHKGCGQVMSVHSDGDLVPHVEEHVMGTKDAPAALVRRYKSMRDGHAPTSFYTAHKCAFLSKRAPLEAPSKKKHVGPESRATVMPSLADATVIDDTPELPSLENARVVDTAAEQLTAMLAWLPAQLKQAFKDVIQVEFKAQV